MLAFRQELALQPFSQALRCLESSLKIDELRSSWNAETVATSLAAALGDGLWCWSFETTSDEVDSAHKALKTMLEDGRKQLLEALRSGESFCATVKRCTSKKDGQALMKLGKTRVMWLLGSGPDEGNDLSQSCKKRRRRKRRPKDTQNDQLSVDSSSESCPQATNSETLKFLQSIKARSTKKGQPAPSNG